MKCKCMELETSNIVKFMGVSQDCGVLGELAAEFGFYCDDGKVTAYLASQLGGKSGQIDIGEEDVGVKFCPFCGRKLEE